MTRNVATPQAITAALTSLIVAAYRALRQAMIFKRQHYFIISSTPANAYESPIVFPSIDDENARITYLNARTAILYNAPQGGADIRRHIAS